MRRAIFCGWIVVLVTSVVLVVTAGVRAAPGAFLLSVTEEPGWSTGAVSIASSVGLVVYGLAGPLSGWLIGRIGVRDVALVAAGAIAIIAGLAAMAIRRTDPGEDATDAAVGPSAGTAVA